MNRKLWSFALLVGCSLAFALPAFALKDSEYQAFLKNEEFRQADQALGAAWKNAKSQISEKHFVKLKEEQRQWVRSGRDQAAKEWMDAGHDKVTAYTIATSERADYLEKQVEELWLIANADGTQGLYKRHDEGMPGTLRVRWENRRQQRVSVNVEALLYLTPTNARSGLFAEEGTLNKARVLKFPQGVTMTFKPDSVTIKCTDEFLQSGELGMGVTLDGVYKRVTE